MCMELLGKEGYDIDIICELFGAILTADEKGEKKDKMVWIDYDLMVKREVEENHGKFYLNNENRFILSYYNV